MCSRSLSSLSLSRRLGAAAESDMIRKAHDRRLDEGGRALPVLRIHATELTGGRSCGFFLPQLRFHSMKAKMKLETWDANDRDYKISLFKRRSPVTEVVAAEGMVFGLTQSGTCSAFSLQSGARLCLLNIHPMEVIRSIFFNRQLSALITISVYRFDEFSSLHCRSTALM